MSQNIAERKILELEQKLANLDAEFKYWLDQSRDGELFEKHSSQINAITTILEQLQKGARICLQSVTTTEGKLAVGHRVERMTLATHRIWEFFRSKFAQRKEARLQCYLAAADEFAWACYRPVRDIAAANHPTGFRKEPPLVFFNGGLSPFSISRDRIFEAELVPNELLSGSDLTRVLNSLPVPVIGVPWHQVSHLPDALVIGHEVGHIVEDDFNLTPDLNRHLQEALDTGGIDGAHHEAWRAWLGEVFADLYGCLATGPAFVSSLMDFLVDDPQAVCQERVIGNNFWEYPTTQLRVLINLEALRRLGFTKAVQNLERDWLAFYPSHQLTAFEPDVEKIVSALLDATYPQLDNRSLKQIFCFSHDQQKDAELTMRQITINRNLANSTLDFRALFAAVRLAYAENPADFVQRRNAEMVLKRIGEVIRPGMRSGERALTTQQGDSLRAQHTTVGEKMFGQLWAAVDNLR